MFNHLPFESLADLAEGRLTVDERAASEAHMAACARCANQFERLNGVVGLMREDRGKDAPPELISRAVSLFRRRATLEEPSLIKRIAAALSFDSLTMSPAYGVRSTSQESSRQLLYSAGDYDLDLRLTQSGETWTVKGQVLGGACAGGHIELEGLTRARADFNEQCEFTLGAIPTGSYNLRLRLPDLEVEIPQFELRA